MLRRVLGVSARRLSTRRAYTTLNNVPRRTPPTPLLARSILNTHSNSSIATSSSALPAEDTRPRLSLTFTCTAGDCNHRSSHTFTKLAYEKGTVIIQCPACKNRHLIADHLGWFKEVAEENGGKNIEDFMRAKGEGVRRGQGRILDGDVIEFVEEMPKEGEGR